MQNLKSFIFAIFFWLTIASPGIRAQSSAPNGCGSGWNTYLVPDSIPIMNCKFENSCNKHDACYGKCIAGTPDASNPACRYLQCRSGGSLAGQSICSSKQFKQLAIDASKRRLACDLSFYTDLLKDNPKNLACQTFSALYREMVMVFGSDSFLGAGADSELALYQWSTPYETEQAIGDILSYGSRDHLISTIQRLNSSNSHGKKLDLSKPVVYDKQLGLVNR
jgi:hypothetical protein